MSLLRIFGRPEARSTRRATLGRRPGVEALDGRLLLAANFFLKFSPDVEPAHIVNKVASPVPSDAPGGPVEMVQKVREAVDSANGHHLDT